MKNLGTVLTIALLLGCSSENRTSQKKDLDPPKVASVNYPLHYFAQRIGQDLIEAQFRLPGGIDPAYWQPTVEEVQEIQQADLILDNGGDYAKWMKQVSLLTSRIINTSSEFNDALIDEGGGVKHSHGPEGEHSHGELAFTIWLDFKLAILQSESIKNALIGILPDQQDLLENNLGALVTDLRILDQGMDQIASNFKGRTLLASHPVYQYLGNGYGFKIRSEHWEPDVMPPPEDLESFQEQTAGINNPVMLWEAEPLPEMRQRLDEMDVRIVVFQPCGNQPPQGDFLSVMKVNLENLKAATANMKPVRGHD